MAGDGSLKTIDKAAASVEAQLQIYFHKTSGELEKFQTLVELLIKLVKKYNNLDEAGFGKNAAAQKAVEEMQELVAQYTTQLEIIHQYLGEEFAIVAQYFPSDLVKEVKEINEGIETAQRQISKITHYVLCLTYLCGLKQENASFQIEERTGELLANTLSHYIDAISELRNKLKIEERLEKEEREVALQKTANNIFLTWKKLIQETVEEHIKEYIKFKKIELIVRVEVEIQERSSMLPKGEEEVWLQVLFGLYLEGRYREYNLKIGFSPKKDCFWAETNFPGNRYGVTFHESIIDILETRLDMKNVV